MDSEVETLEERLKSFLVQLQTECGILERLVYKNKNQHRRCSYFQYLLKVRRDLRLLQSAKLEELLNSCFLVITGKKPRLKVYLLESLKRRKCEVGKFNFMERLLGVARLLSQMVEPMLKAATDISVLLARSFFMAFSLTILALLGRLRVLVQQILLDVVSVFNIVSSLSQKKQSVKLNEEGIEVFGEVYPRSGDFVTLECVWKTDKFILHERLSKSAKKGQDGDPAESVALKASSVKYQSIEPFLSDVDNELGSGEDDADDAAKKCVIPLRNEETNATARPILASSSQELSEGADKMEDLRVSAEIPAKDFSPSDSLLAASISSPSSNPSSLRPSTRKVAFISVKPTPVPATKSVDLKFQETGNNNTDDAYPFFNLLTGGNSKDSLF